MSSRERARRLPTGQDLIRELERTLGLGVMVQSIDERPRFTIRALLMFGQYSDEVTAVGPTEADAWRELAQIAVAWRNANDKQVPLWWGGGGAV